VKQQIQKINNELKQAFRESELISQQHQFTPKNEQEKANEIDQLKLHIEKLKKRMDDLKDWWWHDTHVANCARVLKLF
jgi:ubiquinone biosynthesis protein UbiJ